MYEKHQCQGGRSTEVVAGVAGAWLLGALLLGWAAFAGPISAQTGLSKAAEDPGSREVQEVTLRDTQRVRLSPKPTWSISGAWSADGKSLLLVDAKGEVLEEKEVEAYTEEQIREAFDQFVARLQGSTHRGDA